LAGGADFIQGARPGAPWPHIGAGAVFLVFLWSLKGFVNRLKIAPQKHFKKELQSLRFNTITINALRQQTARKIWNFLNTSRYI